MSLEINRGDIVGIVGPSGVGKSTFLNLFLGLLKQPVEKSSLMVIQISIS